MNIQETLAKLGLSLIIFLFILFPLIYSLMGIFQVNFFKPHTWSEGCVAAEAFGIIAALAASAMIGFNTKININSKNFH